MQGEGDFYSVAEAERLLGRTDKPISERRIRQMLQAGDLEGKKEVGSGRWYVSQAEVHRLMQERRQAVPEGPPGGPENASEMLDRVFALEREIGRLQGRLELEERAESTVREERDRLLQDLEAEKAERRRLQERLEERERPWWRRMFGG
jgi:hypothetical protein